MISEADRESQIFVGSVLVDPLWGLELAVAGSLNAGGPGNDVLRPSARAIARRLSTTGIAPTQSLRPHRAAAGRGDATTARLDHDFAWR